MTRAAAWAAALVMVSSDKALRKPNGKSLVKKQKGQASEEI